MIYINAAKRIKRLRIQKGLTQKQLGEAVGVKGRYISMIESTSRKASLTFYKDIADYFMVSLNFLFSLQKFNIFISKKEKGLVVRLALYFF